MNYPFQYRRTRPRKKTVIVVATRPIGDVSKLLLRKTDRNNNAILVARERSLSCAQIFSKLERILASSGSKKDT